ncbi:LysR family transcriptional regulator [Rhizobium leguminosarum]|uniref:LysR family transcriptional regulator n=1 Tax=Rhizobium leguminosarum TaxID=384 RepID=UPI0024A9E786|nr:LysR family transcriptional regulator [Rhizobium leguminosarum]MDI5929370.1 LysR family transcriptional regulator [Rhizobium leguminosarum]
MSSIVSIESLSGLVAFSIAVETGSFAAAGRKLGLSASAVGKAVERLEARLGLRLLNRTTRSLAVTGEGDILYRYVSRILKELQDAEQELHLVQKAPRGRLKVSVPTVLGRKIVMPALLDFRTRFPEVTTEISLDDVKVDIIEGGYDVVLRLGELDDSTLRARRIGPHTFTTCASPGYLAHRGIPQSPADLHNHCCIYYRFPTTGRPEVWAFKNSPHATPIKPSTILNDGEALASAALGGLGIIQVPSYLVSDDIAAGRLQAILADYTDERGSVSLVWPPMSARAPKVRAFIDFMAERVSQKLY